jgi:hypothetical protein
MSRTNIRVLALQNSICDGHDSFETSCVVLARLVVWRRLCPILISHDGHRV